MVATVGVFDGVGDDPEPVVVQKLTIFIRIQAGVEQRLAAIAADLFAG